MKIKSRKYVLSLLAILVLITSVSIPFAIQSESSQIIPTRPDTGCIVSAEDLILNVSYHTPDDPVEKPVNEGDRLEGDHVILTATWTPASYVNATRIEVFASAIPARISEYAESFEVDIDTRRLGNNASCVINVTAWLMNGSIYSDSIANVFISNFFVPHVQVLTPNGGEVWVGTHNITWSASDQNEDETLTFEVLVSSDNGSTFESVESNLSVTWYEWNCSGCKKMNSYYVEVRVTDGIYIAYDRSDEAFTAGTVTTTTTTTTSPTTTPTTTDDPRVAIFLVLFVVSSGVMALIVYYAAKKWF
ncbi:MAG: hypothetical protein ACFE7R_05785 [Candidatus Hodarchaeota archaeon]